MRPYATLALIALLTTATPTLAGYQHDAYNETFSAGVAGWTGNGDFFFDGFYGDLTPNGAARNLGSGNHVIQSPCIRVDGNAVDFPDYALQVSIRASVAASANVKMEFYYDTNCTDLSGPGSGDVSLPADTFQRFTADFPIYQNERSVRLFVTVTPNVASYFSSFVDDFRLIQYGPKELLQNVRFHDDTSGWNLWWGDTFSHIDSDGNLSPGGSAQVDGHVDTFAGIGSECVDVRDLPGRSFHVGASIKPPSNAPGTPISGMYVDLFANPDCTSSLGNTQAAAYTNPGEWSRVQGDIQLSEGTQSLRVIVVTYGASDGGTTLFDDATLYSTAIFTDGFESGDLGSWSTVVQ